MIPLQKSDMDRNSHLTIFAKTFALPIPATSSTVRTKLSTP
jgi:hypothetical protein